jgi:eukaryotic-like serine/threonine-protein kinase
MPSERDDTRSSTSDDVLEALLLRMAASESRAATTGESTGGAAPVLEAGTIVASRFQLQGIVGRGGMGTVYRARDLSTGAVVALKAASNASRASRIRQEADVLASLSHPAIVRFVAEGFEATTGPFLVMEWLEGEDLSTRLSRGALTSDDCTALIQRVAEGLAFAHARGVVHRDIKPSNVFLVGGRLTQAKILDFGIAGWQTARLAPERPEPVLGSVGYMAPEQATGADDVDARADIFALGCVIFESLTGRPAFSGRHDLAVLAKLLREDPPRVSEVRPDVGADFDELVARMLAKRRERRPPSAIAVLEALHSRGAAPSPSAGATAPRLMSTTEQHWVTVMLARRKADLSRPEGATSTSCSTESQAELRGFLDTVRRGGAEVVPMRGGALLLVLSGDAAALDLAAHGASCALSLARLRPDLEIGVGTGRAETLLPMPVGAAIDRAADSLRVASETGVAIVLDDLTSSLLGSRVELRPLTNGTALVGERANPYAQRLLMGKPTPCVGREKELILLEATLDECIRDEEARTVLVTAPAGIGKSRLISEFLAGTRTRGPARVLFAQADPMTAGSPLVLTQQLVRDAVGLRGQSAPEESSRLLSYLQRIGGRALAPLAEFVGELAGVRAASKPSPSLRAARNDPTVMRVQIRRAFEGWLEAELAQTPLLLVLEDLHWGDAPTVELVCHALRRFAKRSLMVVAIGRPEAHALFPNLWQGASLHEVRLGGLTRRAAEQLVRATLGATAATKTVERVVELADGNAFYLEELIRCVAQGDQELPESVLAMAQSRLERLDADLRLVLRAASIFGQSCWAGGVEALVGTGMACGALERLCDHEILLRGSATRFAGEREYVFRHALLRGAAAAMLTDEALLSAHQLAGEWLQRAGEKDVRILADHFERGGQPHRAIPLIAHAAHLAIEAGDVDVGVSLARRGFKLGAAGEARGLLLVTEALPGIAWGREGRTEALEEALDLLERGSAFWWLAVSLLIWSVAKSGQLTRAAPYVQLTLTAPPDSELTGPHGLSVHLLVIGLYIIGQPDLAWAVVDRFAAAAAGDANCDPAFQAWIEAARSNLGHRCPRRGVWQLERSVIAGRESVETMAKLGSPVGETLAAVHLAAACRAVGRYDEAEAACERTLELSRRTGISMIGEWATIWLAMVRTRRRRPDEAISLLESVRCSSDANVVQMALAASAEAYERIGRLELALPLAVAAADGQSPPFRRVGGAILARILVSCDRPSEALTACDVALGQPHVFPEMTTALLTARADALRVIGDDVAAASAARAARAFVLEVAGAIDDPGLRESFLDVDYNSYALSLCGSIP